MVDGKPLKSWTKSITTTQSASNPFAAWILLKLTGPSHRPSTNFLFGKIFNSVLNEEHIEIGDTYYYRDLLHTSYVASICQNVSEDKIIGSGRMFFVNDFIRDLYKAFGLKYEIHQEALKILEAY